MENIFEKAKQIISKLIDSKQICGAEALILMEALICKKNGCQEENLGVEFIESANVTAGIAETEENETEPQKIPQTYEEWQKYPNGFTVIEDRGVYVDPITGNKYPQHSYKYIQNPYKPIHTYLNGEKLTESSVD